MAIVHHEFPLSPNCLKVRVVAAELGIDIESRPVDFATGDNRTPEYLRMNPNGKVPTLDDGGFVLWESGAIMAYLAEKKPERGLYPSDTKQRAAVNCWLLWNSQHFEGATGTIVYERVVKPMLMKQPGDEAMAARGEEQLKRHLGVLNNWLESHSYVANERLSIADIAIAAALSLRAPAQMPVAGYPHVERWLGRMESMDSWKKAAPKM